MLDPLSCRGLMYTQVKLCNIQLVQGLSSAKVCVGDRDRCVTRILRIAEEAEVCTLWEHTREIRSKHKNETAGISTSAYEQTGSDRRQ